MYSNSVFDRELYNNCMETELKQELGVIKLRIENKLFVFFVHILY